MQYDDADSPHHNAALFTPTGLHGAGSLQGRVHTDLAELVRSSVLWRVRIPVNWKIQQSMKRRLEGTA